MLRTLFFEMADKRHDFSAFFPSRIAECPNHGLMLLLALRKLWVSRLLPSLSLLSSSGLGVELTKPLNP